MPYIKIVVYPRCSKNLFIIELVTSENDQFILDAALNFDTALRKASRILHHNPFSLPQEDNIRIIMQD